jgi:hypothetical protein
LLLSWGTDGTISNLDVGKEDQNWAYEQTRSYSDHEKSYFVRMCIKGERNEALTEGMWATERKKKTKIKEHNKQEGYKTKSNYY